MDSLPVIAKDETYAISPSLLLSSIVISDIIWTEMAEFERLEWN